MAIVYIPTSSSSSRCDAECGKISLIVGLSLGALVAAVALVSLFCWCAGRVARRRKRAADLARWSADRERMQAVLGRVPALMLLLDDRKLWPTLQAHYNLSSRDEIPAMGVVAQQRLEMQKRQVAV